MKATKSESYDDKTKVRNVPSANSQKIIWDGLTDFERIRKEEMQVK